MTQAAPLDPLGRLMADVMARGGTVWAAPPCVKARGYTQEHWLPSVVITSASAVRERLKAGAATLIF